MFIDTTDNRPTAVILCGPPGSGKTTFRQKYLEDWVCLSSDDILLDIAQKQNTTYKEAFDQHKVLAFRTYEESLNTALHLNINFAIDRTNLTVKSRKALLKRLSGYRVVAVYFGPNSTETLNSRIEARAKVNTQYVPASVVESMQASYEIPSTEEGFAKVIAASNYA